MKKPIGFVIEDDLNLSLAFAQALKDADYTVEVFRDGKLAANRLLEISPDTVVLDLHIPQVSGVRILESIEMDPRHARTRIIITTADDRKAEELQNRVDLVLIKPVGYRQLRDFAVQLRPEA